MSAGVERLIYYAPAPLGPMGEEWLKRQERGLGGSGAGEGTR